MTTGKNEAFSPIRREVGQHRQALAAGPEVTAVARHPEVMAPTGPYLRVVYDDVLDPASLGDGVVGADAVLSAPGR